MIENKHAVSWLTEFLSEPTASMDTLIEQLYTKYLKDTHVLHTNKNSQTDQKKWWIWIKLKENWTEKETFTAHVDTVSDYSAAPLESEIIYENGILKLSQDAHPNVRCLGGDDRAGVAMLWKVVEKITRDGMKANFNLFFPYGEETGTQGTREFLKLWKTEFKTPYMLGFDRRGDDVVAYNNRNEDFVTEVAAAFEKKVGYGSCSDISVFQDELKILSVNVSVGFKNEHQRSETLDVSIWAKTTWKLLALLKDAYTREWLGEQKWVERTYTYQQQTPTWSWNGFDETENSFPEKDPEEEKEKLEAEYENGYNDGWEEALKEVSKFPKDYLKESATLIALSKLVAAQLKEALDKDKAKEKEDEQKAIRTKRTWTFIKRKRTK